MDCFLCSGIFEVGVFKYLLECVLLEVEDVVVGVLQVDRRRHKDRHRVQRLPCLVMAVSDLRMQSRPLRRRRRIYRNIDKYMK